ncbi:MAG: multicopper oxidase domain-containing protein [Acidobacteria bacterium]|nr:multicopper oxidase domain-containing protein [Acidobacteriota bacterium]
MRVLVAAAAVAVGVSAAACSTEGRPGRSPAPAATPPPVTATSGSAPLEAPGLPALAGQAATCAGPREKTFALDAREVTLDLGMGMRFNAWTYDGTLPGPTLEACEGDLVTIKVENHANTSHGLDSHALRIDMRRFGAVPPGGTRVIEKAVDTPGVYMYHCASGPVTDIHIKSGLYGAMIVYPRDATLKPARELVVVQSAIYGTPDKTGLIPGTDPARAQKNDPFVMMFNGRLEHAPLPVQPGDLVRAYVVNVGPGVAAIHVIGTILETVYDGASEIRNVQTYGIPAGSGAMVEFRIPEAGVYAFVDHDRLAYLPWGMVLAFDTTGDPHVQTH